MNSCWTHSRDVGVFIRERRPSSLSEMANIAEAYREAHHETSLARKPTDSPIGSVSVSDVYDYDNTSDVSFRDSDCGEWQHRPKRRRQRRRRRFYQRGCNPRDSVFDSVRPDQFENKSVRGQSTFPVSKKKCQY